MRISTAYSVARTRRVEAHHQRTVKRALTGIDAVIQSLGVSAGPEIIFEPTRLGDSRGSGGFLL